MKGLTHFNLTEVSTVIISSPEAIKTYASAMKFERKRNLSKETSHYS